MAQANPSIGGTFGNYRIDAKLGQGGMGVVYKATDIDLERVVAIKTLLGEADEEALGRFMREAKAVSRLQHPTVVTIYHFGVEGETRYIVMEYIEGKTLKALVNKRPMNLRELLDIGIETALGLATAHEKGVVHRDIKAENIMVTTRGGVKILDFGLAKLKQPEAVDGKSANDFKTQAGVIMGTITHMSPEQAMGQEIDARTDIFSFGVVLYEMVTGRTPFAAKDVTSTISRILNHVPEPVTQFTPGTPEELAHIIAECLEKDRELRPSAEQLGRALRNVRDEMIRGGTAAAAPEAGGQTIRVPRGGAPAGPARASGGTPTGTARLTSSQVPTRTAVGPPVKSSRNVTVSKASWESSGDAALPQVDGEAQTSTTNLKAIYWALRGIRTALSIVTATVPLAFLASFVIGGGLIKAEFVEGTAVMSYIRAIVNPVLEQVGQVLNVRGVVDGWNMILPVLAIIAFVLRPLVHMPFVKAEQWAKDRLIKARGVVAKTTYIVPEKEEVAGSHRLAMLREYAEAKKQLFQEKQRYAFLSVDVAESAQMTKDEDKLVVEQAFTEYRRYIERILANNNVWKIAWSQNRLLAAFRATDHAALAGQEILTELRFFNIDVHQLRKPFRLRVGVNAGELVFPEDKLLEDVTDHVTDLAEEMQRSAPPNRLWLSAAVANELADADGFSGVSTVVQGSAVFEWAPEWAAGETRRPEPAAAVGERTIRTVPTDVPTMSVGDRTVATAAAQPQNLDQTVRTTAPAAADAKTTAGTKAGGDDLGQTIAIQRPPR